MGGPSLSRSKSSKPTLTRSASSSWVCETLKSSVFTPGGGGDKYSAAAPPPSSKTASAQRAWLPSDAAGLRREDVSSSQQAASSFFKPGRAHGHYPAQRELMTDILYGKEPNADEKGLPSSQRRRTVVVDGAAGRQHTVADMPDNSAADRHPHLQKSIRADEERVHVGTHVKQDQMLTIGDARATASELFRTGSKKAAPELLKAKSGKMAGSYNYPKTPGADVAPKVIYHHHTTSSPYSHHDESSSSSSTALNLHPQHQQLEATPRRMKKANPQGTTFTTSNLTTGTLTVDAAARTRERGGGGGGGGMVDVSDPSSSSDVPNILSHAYLHSAATASGGAGAPAMRLQYADGGEGGDGGGGGGDGGGGMKTPRPHHAWQEPKSGRATGAYNPLYASDVKGVYTGRGVYTASPSVPNAGVLSSRLHALSAAAVAPIARYDQQRTVNTERRAAGAEEQRAGAGKFVPVEEKVCGPHRKKAPDDNPQVKPRNTVLGEDMSGKDAARIASKGRLHLGNTVPASADHLESSTLVPDKVGSGYPAGKRGSGKAVGDRASHAFTYGGETAKLATAGWSAHGLDDSDTSAGGKRHIEAPTRAVARFDLTHEAAAKAGAPFAGVPSLQHQGKSNARLHHFVESPRKQPSFARSESFSARSDARSAYSLIKTKSSSSLIFADLSYPTGSADE